MSVETCQPFFTVLRGARVLAPEDLGCRDVLLVGEKLAAMASRLEVPPAWNCREVRLDGYTLVPGLIDGHVHLIGGGGEGGYHTRTPEVTLSGLTKAGVTTVVGCLGTDGTTRHMASLLAKARGLESEGVTTFIYSGAYEVPTVTLTGSVRADLILIDKVIGAGEIAISDHRSSQPLRPAIQQLAAEARVGGLLSGKAGVLHLHVGDGKSGLGMLSAIVDESEIPITQFVPTHLNRNPQLLQEAIAWGRRGGFIDFTSGVSPASGVVRAVRASRAVAQAVAAGVGLDRITISSDGNGSMPLFDDKGAMAGLMVASLDSLLAELRALVLTEGMPLDQAIQVVTGNVAKALKLWPRKGTLQVGADADLLVLDGELNPVQVWARGRLMLEKGEPVVWGTFERQLG